MAFKMKNPSMAKMAKQAGSGSPMQFDVKDMLNKAKSKVKKAARKAELFFDQTYYSNLHKAENAHRYPYAKINQPKFKEEKEELLLKEKGPQTLYRTPKATKPKVNESKKSNSRQKLARKVTSSRKLARKITK